MLSGNNVGVVAGSLCVLEEKNWRDDIQEV